MEVKVKQRTKAWFESRKKVFLTASKFGDVLGVGMGRPYDFFQSLIVDEEGDEDEDDIELENTRHGVTMEQIICEAYQLLTGYNTRETGFWLPQDDTLKDLIGASPDAVILDPKDSSKDIGLCEFKAPIYRMYKTENTVKGIPRHYMAQIQGQMAITGYHWCDFMAVCKNTKEVMLKRIEFEPMYWANVLRLLKQFAYALQDATLRKELKQDPYNFEGAKKLQQWPIQREFLPGELSIPVKDLIKTDSRGRFYGPSCVWMSFDFLIGQTFSLPPNLQFYGDSLIRDVDVQIFKKKRQLSS